MADPNTIGKPIKASTNLVEIFPNGRSVVKKEPFHRWGKTRGFGEHKMLKRG